jgi:alpha-mannosidase
MPWAVKDPSTGNQLKESLAFQTPLLGEFINVPSGAYAPAELSLPSKFSLASASGGQAIITAAKSADEDPSALVLRVYQPTNKSADVTVSLGARKDSSSALIAVPITALETAIGGAQTIPVAGNAFKFTAANALSTVLILKK